MSEILSIVVVLPLLVAAFAGLVAWVRRDTFTATQYREPVRPDSPTRVERAKSAPSIRAVVLRLN